VRAVTANSAEFVDVGANRDSLTPMPSLRPDASCLHARVCGDVRAAGFSAERGHPVFPVRLPTNSVSLSVGDLAPGAATSNHRHAYESVVYVIEGSGYTIMEGVRFDWAAGDAVYTPPWCWHQHHASGGGPVRYLTATNMPLLARCGQTVMREEER